MGPDIIDELIWNCKCKCYSKQTHKAKWAAIYFFKKRKNIGLNQDNPTNLPTHANSIIIKKRNLPNKINKSIPVINQSTQSTQSTQSEQPIEITKQINMIDSSNNLISPSLQSNKKVRYDPVLNKIILEQDEEQDKEENEEQDILNNDVILDKRFDLFELRDLIKK